MGGTITTLSSAMYILFPVSNKSKSTLTGTRYHELLKNLHPVQKALSHDWIAQCYKSRAKVDMKEFIISHNKIAEVANPFTVVAGPSSSGLGLIAQSSQGQGSHAANAIVVDGSGSESDDGRNSSCLATRASIPLGQPEDSDELIELEDKGHAPASGKGKRKQKGKQKAKPRGKHRAAVQGPAMTVSSLP